MVKQKTATREKGAKARTIIRDDAVHADLELFRRVMEPCMVLLRLCDGKHGATLGKVYYYMVKLDALYREEIAGLEEGTRKKMHKIFMARWEYFHKDIMTAAYRFDVEFVRFDFSTFEESEVRAVLKRMAT